MIAPGGGAVQSERVREQALTRHTVVHLEIDLDDAWRCASGKGRPLARDPGRFESLPGATLLGMYESVSDVVVLPADRDALRRALPFVLALREAPSGTRLVWAAAESGDYLVYLGRGLIESGFFPPLGGRRFVVTDEHVARVRVEGDERIVACPARTTRRSTAPSTCCARRAERRRARRPGRARRGRGGR